MRLASNGALSINYAGTGDNSLHVGCTSNAGGIIIKAPGDHYANMVIDSNRSGANNGIFNLAGRWNGNDVAYMSFTTGTDTTNKDDGYIRMYTRESGSSLTERFRIETDGTKVFNNHGGGTIKVGGSSAHTSKIVIADNGGTANGNCLVEGGDGADFFTIQSNGNVKFENGKGINFSATEGSGATTSVLDDYEEGTFTMTMAASTSGTISLTTTIDSLRYTKVGNLVTIHGRVRVESVSSPVGGLQIGGLPFASIGSNSNSQDGYQHFGVNTHGVNFHDSTVQVFGELAPNATGAGIFSMFDNSNWAIFDASLIQGNANEYFGFNFFYHTAT